MKFFQVIGDAIQFDRQIVGKLSKHISAGLRQDVVDALHDYEETKTKDEDVLEETKLAFETLKDKIFEQCEEKAEAGMIQLSDLETILENVNLDESCS